MKQLRNMISIGLPLQFDHLGKMIQPGTLTTILMWEHTINDCNLRRNFVVKLIAEGYLKKYLTYPQRANQQNIFNMDNLPTSIL